MTRGPSPSPSMPPGPRAPSSDDRAILASGRGRVVALAIAVGAVLPVAILRHRGDALLAGWAASQRAGDAQGFWRWIGIAGSPGAWLVAAVVGFGTAAAFNWPNTARWMGLLALAVLWAGLADIAVAGQSSGMATIGAATCTLILWQGRAWPLWLGLGMLIAIGRIVADGGTGSGLLLGSVLGTLGVLAIEYAWHHASPDAPPLRGASAAS